MESAMLLPFVLLLALIYGVPGQQFGGYRAQRFMPMFMQGNLQRAPVFIPNNAMPFTRSNIQFSPPVASTGQIVYSSPWMPLQRPQANRVFRRPVINNGIQRQRMMPAQNFIQRPISRHRPRPPAVFTQNARFMQTPLIRTAPVSFNGFSLSPGFNSLKHAKKKKKQRISVLADPLVDIRPFPVQSMAHHHMKKKARMKHVAKAKSFDRLLPGISMTRNKP